MSEPQTEYETEHETDAEPTPGPARVCNGTHVRAHPEKAGMDTEIIMGPSHYGNDLPQEEQRANAELTSAAFTAAQEARGMGYDPQEAVEALTKGLQAARKAIIDLQEAHTSGAPEDSAETAAQAASHRLKVFMAEAGADEPMIPGDASVALASAEGSDQ